MSGPQQSSGSCGQSLVTGPLGIRRFHNNDLPFLLCGDAAESFDPLGGMGMSHALVSGGLAAKAAIKILAQGNCKKIIADYEKQRDIAARQHRGFTRLARANMQQLLPSRFIPAPALGLLGSWVESGLGNSDSLAGRLISLVGR